MFSLEDVWKNPTTWQLSAGSLVLFSKLYQSVTNAHKTACDIKHLTKKISTNPPKTYITRKTFKNAQLYIPCCSIPASDVLICDFSMSVQRRSSSGTCQNWSIWDNDTWTHKHNAINELLFIAADNWYFIQLWVIQEFLVQKLTAAVIAVRHLSMICSFGIQITGWPS